MRYYFHIRLRGELLSDRDGAEMPGIVEARVEAEKIARELADDLILDMENVGANAVEVTGQGNRLLFSVMMCRAAGQIEPASL